MSPLRRKLGRDLWRMKWRSLAIVLTVASGVAVYAGVYTGLLSLFFTRDSIYRELRFADLELRFLPDDARNLPELAGVAGVASLERRLVLPGTLRLGDGASLAAVMTFVERPQPAIHAFEVVRGRLFRPDELDAVVIDVGLATHHQLGVDDVVEVQVGEAVYRRRVVGVVLTAEYFVATSNPAYFLPSRGSLGILFGNLESISDTLGFTMVNDLIFRFEDDADAARVKREVLTQASKLNVQDVIPRDRHFAHRFVQSQLDGVRTFVPAIVVVLVTLTFVVVAVNVGRRIDADRVQIATLKALGYGPARLVRAYMEVGLGLAVLGSVLGLALSFVVGHVFATVSARSMGMPEVRMTTDRATMAEAAAGGILVTLAATALPVSRLARRPVQSIMQRAPRPIAPRRATPGRARRALVHWLPAPHRHAVRNLVRRRVRTAVTVAAIALALGVATAYRLSVGSLDTTLGRWLAGDPWDLAVDFLHPVPLDRLNEMRALPTVVRAEPYFACWVEIHAGGRVADASLLGLVAGSDMSTLKLAQGRPFGPGREREAIVTRDLSQRLGVGVGDVVEVQAMTERYPVRIVGLNWAAIGGLSLVSLPVAQEVCQFPDRASGAYLETAGDPPLGQLAFVGKILAKRDVAAQVKQLLALMITVLDLATAISILVSMLVILTSISLSVLDNDREFATLQALGYSRRLVSTIVLGEVAVYAIGAAALSIPIAIATTLYLNDRLSLALIQVDSRFPPATFAAVLVPGILAVPLGAVPALRHVLRRDFLTRLRERTLE